MKKRIYEVSAHCGEDGWTVIAICNSAAKARRAQRRVKKHWRAHRHDDVRLYYGGGETHVAWKWAKQWHAEQAEEDAEIRRMEESLFGPSPRSNKNNKNT